MKRTKLLLVAALALVICLPGMAMAVTIAGGPVDNPIDWSQAWNEADVGNFNAVEAFITVGATDFQSPISGLPSGWTGNTYVGFPDYTNATGLVTTSLNFTTSFTVAQSVPFTMDLLAWNGGILGTGTVVDAVHAIWSGAGWSFVSFTTDGTGYARPSAVPIPPSALLLGSGLLGLVGLGWRRRKES